MELICRIRWIIIGGIFLLVTILLLLAYVLVIRGNVDGRYWHARRRLAKGLRPMAYHAWMIPYVCLAFKFVNDSDC